MIKLISPKKNAEISLLTALQKEFIHREKPLKNHFESISDDVVYPWLSRDTVESFNQSAPISIIFKWKVDDILSPMKFDIALNPDFKDDCLPCSVATIGEIFADYEEECVYCVKVDNLLGGSKYYWRVTVGDESEIGSFSTVYGEIRPIRIEGLINHRDMGGRVNSDGRRIKQGLIYRGGCFDDLLEPNIAQLGGMKVVKKDMRIKTDIDLRSESVNFGYKSALIPFDAYGATLNDVGRAALRKILELFADETNYPIFFHCAVGADRTGTIGMYLDTILGMSDEDIVLNYQFTSLAGELIRSWWHTDDSIGIHQYLEEIYPDLSIRERLLKNLMLSGISEETLDKIRSIMLE